MPLIQVVLTLIVVGVLLWLINTYIPMQSAIKSIINIVVVIAVILWLLYGFGGGRRFGRSIGAGGQHQDRGERRCSFQGETNVHTRIIRTYSIPD